MKFSQTFIPTLKENPNEAEVVSHRLMLRAGLTRKLAAGIYTWLPLGQRVLQKVSRVVRQEMNAAGAQEILMPGVQPADLWQESGRWEHYGRELLRFVDRHDHEFCLAPTHEEVVTDLVRKEVRSYRELPLNLYQIQTKFRDEIRPRFGVMRAREFIMKDAYSFDADEEGSVESYRRMVEAYKAVFNRLGLRFKMVEADSGSIGGSFSHEFMVLADTGEDAIASCLACDYAANLEKAEVILPESAPAGAAAEIAKVSTPGAHTVDEVAAFLKVEPRDVVKTLIYLADGRPVAALVRGDRQLNEIKLAHLIGAVHLELASPADILKHTGGPVGFSGPLGLSIPIYADRELAFIPALVAGANEADTHVTGLNLTRDVAGAVLADIRDIAADDACPRCGGGLEFARGIEVGHTFRLGTKYSEALGARYLDADGKEKTIIMGCYGIGVSRVVAAAIEQGHDGNGIIFPMPIAPVAVAVLPMQPAGEALEAAKKLHDDLWAAGVDALIDDRDVRPGVKFKDSDLLGIPLRLVVGPKGLKEGKVEFKRRTGGEMEMLPLESAVEQVKGIFLAEGGQPAD